jgi:hypothetical protein
MYSILYLYTPTHNYPQHTPSHSHRTLPSSVELPFQSFKASNFNDTHIQHIKSTYILRVPQSMSPRGNWDSPPPLPQTSVPLPPGTTGGGGAHSPAGEGVREYQFRRLEKNLALCLLCVLQSTASIGSQSQCEQFKPLGMLWRFYVPHKLNHFKPSLL